MRHSQCRACGASIIWATTKNGRKMPVDAEGVRMAVLDEFPTGGSPRVRIVTCRKPHHSTCPNAGDFRRARS